MDVKWQMTKFSVNFEFQGCHCTLQLLASKTVVWGRADSCFKGKYNYLSSPYFRIKTKTTLPNQNHKGRVRNKWLFISSMPSPICASHLFFTLLLALLLQFSVLWLKLLAGQNSCFQTVLGGYCVTKMVFEFSSLCNILLAFITYLSLWIFPHNSSEKVLSVRWLTNNRCGF